MNVAGRQGVLDVRNAVIDDRIDLERAIGRVSRARDGGRGSQGKSYCLHMVSLVKSARMRQRSHGAHEHQLILRSVRCRISRLRPFVIYGRIYRDMRARMMQPAAPRIPGIDEVR